MEKIIRELEAMEIKVKNEKDILSAIANKLKEKEIDYYDKEELLNIQIRAQIALNYKNLKKSVSEIIKKQRLFIVLKPNTNVAYFTFKQKDHKIKDINRIIFLTLYLDNSLVTDKLKVFKLKNWYINKLYYKFERLNVNISVKELEGICLEDISKESFKCLQSEQNLNCIQELKHNNEVVYIKSSDSIISSTNLSISEIKSFEQLSKLTYSSDKELSQVFKALSDCGIPLNEELFLSIINNTDTTEFILLALDLLKSEFDRLSNVARNLAFKQLKRESITKFEEVGYKGLLRSIKKFKEEIEKLEDLEESI